MENLDIERIKLYELSIILNNFNIKVPQITKSLINSFGKILDIFDYNFKLKNPKFINQIENNNLLGNLENNNLFGNGLDNLENVNLLQNVDLLGNLENLENADVLRNGLVNLENGLVNGLENGLVNLENGDLLENMYENILPINIELLSKQTKIQYNNYLTNLNKYNKLTENKIGNVIGNGNGNEGENGSGNGSGNENGNQLENETRNENLNENKNLCLNCFIKFGINYCNNCFKYFCNQCFNKHSPVTVTGPTGTGTEVTGIKDTNNLTTSNTKDIGTVGASTVTEENNNTKIASSGKGANSTLMECTMGKGAKFTAMECTMGKGANSTATECTMGTPGKGANFTLMECTTTTPLYTTNNPLYTNPITTTITPTTGLEVMLYNEIKTFPYELCNKHPNTPVNPNSPVNSLNPLNPNSTLNPNSPLNPVNFINPVNHELEKRLVCITCDFKLICEKCRLEHRNHKIIIIEMGIIEIKEYINDCIGILLEKKNSYIPIKLELRQIKLNENNRINNIIQSINDILRNKIYIIENEIKILQQLCTNQLNYLLNLSNKFNNYLIKKLLRLKNYLQINDPGLQLNIFIEIKNDYESLLYFSQDLNDLILDIPHWQLNVNNINNLLNDLNFRINTNLEEFFTLFQFFINIINETKEFILSITSVTVLGQAATNGSKDSKDISSKGISSTTGTIGASTVTEENNSTKIAATGKGANSTLMECTPGKGANFTAMECTMGKGANFTAMECTMGIKDTKGVGVDTKVAPFGVGGKGAKLAPLGVVGRGPHTVTEEIIYNGELRGIFWRKDYIHRIICKRAIILYNNKLYIFNNDNPFNTSVTVSGTPNSTSPKRLTNTFNTGKGANSTMGKGANDTFSTTGKGTIGASTVTEGKGAIGTRFESQSSNTTGRGPDTVMEEIESIIELKSVILRTYDDENLSDFSKLIRIRMPNGFELIEKNGKETRIWSFTNESKNLILLWISKLKLLTKNNFTKNNFTNNNFNNNNFNNNNLSIGKDFNLPIPPINKVNSSVTVSGPTGKGANDTFNTTGKGANDTFGSPGKGANSTAMECTTGKGANDSSPKGAVGTVGASTVTNDFKNISIELKKIKENSTLLYDKCFNKFNSPVTVSGPPESTSPKRLTDTTIGKGANSTKDTTGTDGVNTETNTKDPFGAAVGASTVTEEIELSVGRYKLPNPKKEKLNNNLKNTKLNNLKNTKLIENDFYPQIISPKSIHQFFQSKYY
uniref:Uncharacterized protein n=1 Tax=Theileria annulata TaxID=5874 RepID=A0A3B0MK83_THEAN